MQQDFFDTPRSEGKAFIYRSSAGSGKTFTLAKAFLKLVLLDPSRYNKILAITFTNKAKDEMKSRIIAYLSSLAADEQSDMRAAILSDFNNEGIERIEDVVTKRAQLVLNKLLHDYSRFHVSTIDHFFTRLIRHLAKELKLNTGYELDIDSTTALAESIDLLFRSADKKLLRWLNDFALEQIENEKSWDVRQNIADLGRKLFHESYLDIEQSLRENSDALPDLINANQQIVRNFKKTLLNAAEQGVNAAQSQNLTKADFKSGMPLNYMEKVVAGGQDINTPPSNTFLNALTLDSWHTQKCQRVDYIQKAREAGMEEAHATIVELYEGNRFKEYLEATAILRFIHSYGILSSLAKSVQQYRSEKNLMFISDSAFVLHDIIKESEIPFIYERMGSEIEFILIDEFQDTSAYQWKSLLPFFSSVIADGGQVYVVGDVKQSIYGWRGGDLNLLLHQVGNDLQIDDSGIIKLQKNYRSGANIIRFNNSFFKVAASILPGHHGLEEYKPEFELAYEDVDQETNKSFDGLVEIQFLVDEKDNKWKDQANAEVKLKIEDAVADGFNLNDILLLTRKTAEATEIANYLLSEGIPTISESALRLTSSENVQLLISALKILESEENYVALAEFNNFLSSLNKNHPDSYTDTSKLPENFTELKSRPVYEAVEQLILDLGLGMKTDIYLLRFLDITLRQARAGNSTIRAFLEWWTEQEGRDSQEFSLSIPDSEDAVMVLTVHKAKGLEKPVVIIPYADDDMRPKSDIFWAMPLPEKYDSWGSLPLFFSSKLADTAFQQAYNKQYFDTLLESLNLLYVAFTRAGERLYINTKTKGAVNKSAHLIYHVLNNLDFDFNANFTEVSGRFELGKKEPKQSSSKAENERTETRPLGSSRLTKNLVIDKKGADLFLEIASEKSSKVKEGILAHKILSEMARVDDIDVTIDQLVQQGFIEMGEEALLKENINGLFEEIPVMKEWFSDAYEVINERKIFFGRSTLIPDRVMLDNREAIIVDYKREVQDPKHHQQVRKYRNVLDRMGYEQISMYLVYVNERELVKVNG